MASCNICTKTTAVSLYIRAKPVWDARGPHNESIGIGKRWTAPRDMHMFFGYWPPNSHLVKYFELELQRNSQILQPLFENNCRGHSLDDIIEAIEQKIPPIPGIPVRLLWNPSPRVTPLLLTEVWQQKAEAKLEITNDLRTVTVYDKESIRSCVMTLINNAHSQIEKSISYPNSASMRH